MISSVRVLKKKIGSILSYLLGYFIDELYLRLPESKLDLGCGPVKKEGAVGIDKQLLGNVDIVCDIEKNSLPFKDESFDVIYSSNILEHIWNIEWVMMEVYRVLKKNGHFLIRVPYFRSPGAFQDPTHVRYFTLKTFDYYVEKQDVAPKWYFKKHFKKIARKQYIFTRTFLNIIIAPIINSSSNIQTWYEKTIFRIVNPEALEVDIIK